MGLKVGVLTLTGAAQNVLDGVRANVLGTKLQATYDIPLRAISLQPRGTNAAVIYVGDSNLVTSTLYGTRLEAAITGVPPAPWIFGEFESGALKFSDFWVLGTTGEFLHILGLPY